VTKPFDLQSILHTASKITLPGGVVGKVCKVLIVLAIVFAAIAWSVKVVWVSAAALFLLSAIVSVMLWRLISFAQSNPQAAILEGAEFLMHEQLQLGTKANPKIQVTVKDFAEATPVTLAPEEQKNLQQPDTELPQLPGKEEHNG